MSGVNEPEYEKERRTFGKLYDLLFPLVKALYPMRCRGLENIPEGPAVVCANHSNYIDPLLVAAAFGKEHYMHFMAKLELERVPIIGTVLKKCGICFVDRDKSDIDAIRSMMKYLKHGEKVFMFPEGTRVGARQRGRGQDGRCQDSGKDEGADTAGVYPAREEGLRQG